MEDCSAISSAITEILESSPSNQLVGARLQFELTKRFPDFKASRYGYRNLLDFIRRNSARVSIVGRSGGDVIYGFNDRSAQADAPAATPAVLPEFKAERAPSSPTWRTFVSPNATCRIFANTETGEMKNLPLNIPGLGSPWVQIPSAAPETHLEIAREFLEHIDDA